MDRGEIISETLLMLGENSIYNDNKSDMYKICEKMLNSVIDNIATSSAFLFNAITVKLTSVGQVNGENKFNLPVDCLNVLRSNKSYRLENEFIYSSESKIKIQYCRRIDFTEIPDNLFNLMVAMTARKMALAVNTYNNRLEIFDAEVTKLKNNIIAHAVQGDTEILNKIEIMGALNLYLDFINLFLYILRILGRRK